MNRGKLVIVAIVVVALAAAVFSTWYHYRGQHRALDFWGATTAALIAEGPEVELFELDADDPTPVDEVPTASPRTETAGDQAGKADAKDPPVAGQAGDTAATTREFTWVQFGDTAWQVLASTQGAGAKGLSNLRRALVSDTTFDWESPRVQGEEPSWGYAMVVNDGRNWATILFDFDSGLVALTDGRKMARLLPEAADEFDEFFREQFPAPPAGEPAEPAGEQPKAKAAEASDDQAKGAGDRAAPTEAPSGDQPAAGKSDAEK